MNSVKNLGASVTDRNLFPGAIPRQRELNAQPLLKADLVRDGAEPWSLHARMIMSAVKMQYSSMQQEQHPGRDPVGKTPSCPQMGVGSVELKKKKRNKNKKTQASHFLHLCYTPVLSRSQLWICIPG